VRICWFFWWGSPHHPEADSSAGPNSMSAALLYHCETSPTSRRSLRLQATRPGRRARARRVRGHQGRDRVSGARRVPGQEWPRNSPSGAPLSAPCWPRAGSPWENAYLESFNGNLEGELLGGEIFHTLLEARVLIEEYRVSYNHERPHSSLRYRTPAEFLSSLGSSGGRRACGAAAPTPPTGGTT